jgi:hypothetical protein
MAQKSGLHHPIPVLVSAALLSRLPGHARAGRCEVGENLMIRKLLFAAVGALALSLSVPARAATYVASFDGSVFDVSAQITTDGSDNITAISGAVAGINGGPISGLEPLGNPDWLYDNKFFSSGPHVSDLGILFNAGLFLYNLYFEDSAYLLSTFNPDGSLWDPGDPGTLSVAQTPLPGAIWLFGSALAGLTGLIARRRRTSTYTPRPLRHRAETTRSRSERSGQLLGNLQRRSA